MSSEHEHRMSHDGGGWRAAFHYGRHVKDFWRSDVNRVVVMMASPAPGDTALDIGAGMGAGVFIAAGIVGPTGHVIALEPTPFMRRSLAFRRRMSRGANRVEILDGVAEAMPVESATVDVAWAVNVLHHVSDLPAAVDELRRVLRPGARVVFVDEDFDDPAHAAHEKMKARHGSGHHHHEGGDHHHDTDDEGHHHLMVDVDTLAATMRDAGFVDVRSAREPVAGVPALVVTATAPGPVTAAN